MSIWTHVCGSIRYDAIRVIAGENPETFLGNMVSFDDDEGKWDKCDVPRGSEGSLTYHIWDNPCKSSMAAYTVGIFGDLRSFEEEDLPKIKEYLERITNDKFVRSGIVKAECCDTEIIYNYDVEKREWTETINQNSGD